jgi:hypothetical protein
MSDSPDNQGGLQDRDGILNNVLLLTIPASYPLKMPSTHSPFYILSYFTTLSYVKLI